MKYFHIISKEQPVGPILEYFRAEFDKSGLKTYVLEDEHCAFVVDTRGESYGFNPKDNDIERTFYKINSDTSNEWNFKNFIKHQKWQNILYYYMPYNVDNFIKYVLTNFSVFENINHTLIGYYGIYKIYFNYNVGNSMYLNLTNIDFVADLSAKIGVPFHPSPSPLLNFAKECVRHDLGDLSIDALSGKDKDMFKILQMAVRYLQNPFEQLRSVLAGEKIDPKLLLPCVKDELARMGIN